jgi:glucose/arabinose dehydrogenase
VPQAHAIGPQIVLTQIADINQAIVMATRPATGVSYVGTQNGYVYMLHDVGPPTLALDMHKYTKATGERGLLGMAFHPTLAYVYISHTSLAGNSKLAEYKINADGTFKRTSRRLVFIKTQPFANHNGGNVVFGPDGYLYFGFGDGGNAGDPRRYALKLNTWLGKIIRINPRPSRTRAYQIPTDNPFYNVRNAKREIWSIGLRNPWRWEFDSLTGDLWIADVGQGEKEEIDLAKAADGRGKGVSFGWSAYEGTDRYNLDLPAAGHQAPIFEYTHDDGSCSITGGFVYRGSAVPYLYGKYLFADWCSEHLWALSNPSSPSVEELTTVASPVSFGVDADHELYVISQTGEIYRIDPAP